MKEFDMAPIQCFQGVRMLRYKQDSRGVLLVIGYWGGELNCRKRWSVVAGNYRVLHPWRDVDLAGESLSG
ncbi:MAG: hypothetical protein PsegKO_27580 [Pseudohongiellaceae bacterium]